jgi:hypothetical protein
MVAVQSEEGEAEGRDDFTQVLQAVELADLKEPLANPTRHIHVALPYYAVEKTIDGSS